VHAVLADSFIRLPQLQAFVKNFFQVFPIFFAVALSFSPFPAAALADSFVRIPYLQALVKTFFLIF
ncbi:MAG: hypothetical protein KHW65_08210, partial [Clostridiales bacterium]|nr:hypothetical protein [Clostridiales bacterium]